MCDLHGLSLESDTLTILRGEGLQDLFSAALKVGGEARTFPVTTFPALWPLILEGRGLLGATFTYTIGASPRLEASLLVDFPSLSLLLLLGLFFLPLEGVVA